MRKSKELAPVDGTAEEFHSEEKRLNSLNAKMLNVLERVYEETGASVFHITLFIPRDDGSNEKDYVYGTFRLGEINVKSSGAWWDCYNERTLYGPGWRRKL